MLCFITHYPQQSDGTYKKHIKNPSIEENKEMFKENDADIFLYGHTHTFCVNKNNDKWYINVESLGCPMNSNIARAGVLDVYKGEVQFKSIKVEYNIKEVIDEINELKFPFYEEILKIFY